MPSSQTVLSQEDFSQGMVRSVAPHLIDLNGAFDITNGILTDDGSVQKRGGSEYMSTAAIDDGLSFVWDGTLTPGVRTFFASSDNFAVLDSNGTTPINLGGDGLDLPTTATEIEGLLFIGGGYIYGGSRKTANYTTGTVSVTNGSKVVTGSGTTWNTLVDAGMLFQRGQERVYVIESIDSTTQVTLRDAYEGATAAGANYIFRNIYKMTAADPYDASDSYTVSTNRLVWIDGRKIKFSDLRVTAPIANPHLHNTNDEHELPEGVNPLAVATLGPTVLIFSTGGVWRLGGLAYDIVSDEGTPQHAMEPLTRDIVLWGQQGIASWENFLIVPATDGIYLLDGTSSPVRISQNIDPLYQEYVENAWICGGGTVYKNNYILPILSGAGTVRDVLVCRLDRAVTDRRRKVTFPWSHFKDSGAEMAAYTVQRSADPVSPTLIGAEVADTARICDCSNYFKPLLSDGLDADGSVPSFSIITRDYETGALTKNVLRKVRLGYELLDLDSDDPRLFLDYGTGTRVLNAPAWGDPAGAWGTGFGPLGDSPWTAGVEGEFTAIYRAGERDFAPETEQEPHNFRLNKRLRYARLRVRGDERPSENCVVRRLELFIRPSEAVRR